MDGGGDVVCCVLVWRDLVVGHVVLVKIFFFLAFTLMASVFLGLIDSERIITFRSSRNVY